MQDRIFIDTNIVIYFYSNDEVQKQAAAIRLLKNASNTIISTQVINEMTNTLFRKFKLSAKDVENVALELDNILSIVSFSLTTQIRAIKIKEEYKLQFYDSLIIATALENNCNILYSEDMHHGQIIENSLKIINPFESNYE